MANCEIVTDPIRFAQLEPAWEVLWRERGAVAFQSYPWIAAWAAHMGGSYSLKIGLVWRDDRTLCAVLPMAVRHAYGVRILEWAGQEVSDYCDGLGSLSDLQVAWSAVRASGGIDIVRLRHIASSAPVACLFNPEGFSHDDTCPTLTSEWETGDAWFQKLSGKKRGTINRRRRILEEQGTVSIECHDAASDEFVMSEMIRLKIEWMQATSSKSYLLEGNDPKRLLSFVQALEKIGRLRLFVIKCGDDLVAASINIGDGPVVQGFFATYNPKFNRVSPGILMVTSLIRWAFDNGIKKINMGRGEADYKLDYANGRVPLLCFVAAERPPGHVALLAHRLLEQFTAHRRRRSHAVQAVSAPAEAIN